ncbi:MAG: hypothetical protein ACRCZI_02320, partial [Cetobacterium sp.]
KFQPGAQASDYEDRPYTQELDICQSFYFQTTNAGNKAYNVFGTTTACVISILFPSRMIKVPAITHDLTNANFVSGAVPSASQWALLFPGIGYITKTGTVILVTSEVTDTEGRISLTGATWNAAPCLVQMGSSLNIRFSAEI